MPTTRAEIFQSYRLNFDHHSVFCRRYRQLVPPREHLFAKVSEDQLLASQSRQISLQSPVIYVHARLLLKKRALAQEQVDSLGVPDKNIGPRRIAGEKKLFALRRHFECQRNVLGLMRHGEGKYVDAGDVLPLFRLQDEKFNRRQLPFRTAAAVHDAVKLPDALFGPLRTRNRQRVPSRLSIEILDQEKRQTAEMIAVEVAENDRVETPRIESGPLHGEERGRAAIEQKQPIACVDEIAALITPAAAEGIAATENVEFHRLVPSERLQNHRRCCRAPYACGYAESPREVAFNSAGAYIGRMRGDTRPFFTAYTTSLWVRFLRFSLQSHKKLDNDLQKAGLTPPQFYVLATIGYAGGLPFGDIGAKMMVTVSNLTGIVDRLEEKKLVLRKRDEHDRRVVHVVLTDKGAKLYKSTLPLFEKSVSEIFTALDGAQQKELSALLRKLNPEATPK